MRLRIGEIERPGMCGDVADKAFADLQPGFVNRGMLQTLGSKKLKLLRRPHQIDRTHFGDHVGRDQDDDLVEPLLRRLRLRHDLAQPAEQDAGTANGARHQLISLSQTRKCRARLRRDTGSAAIGGSARVTRSPLFAVESISRVQRTHGQLSILRRDQHAHLDLARRDREDVDAFFAERLKHRLGDA